MNRFNIILTCALLAFGGLTTRASEKFYALVSYMHVAPEQSRQEYESMEKLWQRLHQKAADTGLSLGWCLYRLENGGRYQYATVSFYESLEKMAEPWQESLRAGLFDSEETAKMQQPEKLRQVGRRELWRGQAHAAKSPEEFRPVSIHVHYMKHKPGKGRAYFEMERDLYRKIHQARIDDGKMTVWTFLSRMFPSGSDGEYTFITVNGYPENAGEWDSSKARAALTQEEWERMPNPAEVRSIVREEVWHPVLWATPAKPAAAQK